MSMQRELIASALRKLGPERCEQGLAAFGVPWSSWTNCFLALAYSPEPRALRIAVTGSPYGALDDSDARRAAELIGITPDELEAVIEAFDSCRMRNDGPYLDLLHMAQAEAAKARPLANGYFVTSGSSL